MKFLRGLHQRGNPIDLSVDAENGVQMKETAMFVLYGHVYCHLCDDMEAALVALLHEIGNGREFAVDVIDVDEDPALEERFGERVPVLVADGKELCHYFLDHAAVRAYLTEIR